jgi:hypothetical protein
MKDFIKKISVTKVKSAWVDIEDHLCKSSLILTEWSNGEGFDLFISDEKSNEKRIGLTYSEIEGLKKAYKKILKHEKS